VQLTEVFCYNIIVGQAKQSLLKERKMNFNKNNEKLLQKINSSFKSCSLCYSNQINVSIKNKAKVSIVCNWCDQKYKFNQDRNSNLNFYPIF
jgi:RNase P subunit RPR2